MLVTHSFVPARPCKGLALDVVPEVDEPDVAAAALGLRGLRPTDVRNGKITAVDPAWAGAFPLPVGTELKLDRPLVACEGEPLVTLGDAALVTRVDAPGGGTVVYLNFAPPERYEAGRPENGKPDAGPADAARLLRAVLAAVAKKADVTPVAEGAANWAVARYDLAQGNAFLLLDRGRLRESRFTEETPSYDPAAKLNLRLAPNTNYYLYDLLADTLATRRSGGGGRLEVFLSGRSIRLLYVVPVGPGPRVLFTTCERRDGRPRTALPAALHAHRPGRAVVAGIPAGAAVADTALPDGKAVTVERGDHLVGVR